MNNKSLEVVNNACQLMVLPVWSVKSEWSVLKPLWYWLQDYVTCKFIIGHWLVSIDLLIVRSICKKSVYRFCFHLG